MVSTWTHWVCFRLDTAKDSGFRMVTMRRYNNTSICLCVYQSTCMCIQTYTIHTDRDIHTQYTHTSGTRHMHVNPPRRYSARSINLPDVTQRVQVSNTRRLLRTISDNASNRNAACSIFVCFRPLGLQQSQRPLNNSDRSFFHCSGEAVRHRTAVTQSPEPETVVYVYRQTDKNIDRQIDG